MFRKLRSDARGVSAVEFAMLAPVMIMLITGTIEAGHYMMVKTALEGAVNTAARDSIARLTLDQDSRDARMRARIADLMSPYQTAEGHSLSIATTVYKTVGDSYPEAYEDLNENGVYDEGEPFHDRNGNGVRDNSVPVEGKLGDVGDVVRFTVVYPIEPYFALMRPIFGGRMDMKTSIVTRNEPEKGKAI